MKSRIVALISIILALTIPLAHATNRIALVIGNSSYQSALLKSPVNDARGMANALSECGFQVILKQNVSNEDMKKAVHIFEMKLREGDTVGLFYFAGHGVQFQGSNFLIPIGSTIKSEGDVEFEAMNAGFIINKMKDAGNDINIVILDACRINPFSRSFKTSTQGLAPMDAPIGAIVAYASAPDSLAVDGEGKNSPYTKNLIKNIQIPHISIEKVLKRVRIAVASETRNKQVTWESSSLIREFCFISGKQNNFSNISEVEQENLVQQKQKLEKQKLDLEYKKIEQEKQKISLEQEKLDYEQEQIEAEKKKLIEEKTAEEDPFDWPWPNEDDFDWSNENLLGWLNEDHFDSRNTDVSNNDWENNFWDSKEPEIIARDGQYEKYKNNIVYDKKTGLEWFVGPNKRKNWEKAEAWTTSLRLDDGGWRLPTADELMGLYNPWAGARHMTSLLDTKKSTIWAVKEFSIFSPIPYSVDFDWGRGQEEKATVKKYYGRFAVRSRKKQEANDFFVDFFVEEPKIIDTEGDFVKYENNIIYNEKAGLEWLVGPDKDISWKKAKLWAVNLKLEGGGWRLPTKSELMGLSDEEDMFNHTNSLFKTQGWFVWSEKENSLSQAWKYNLKFGSGEWGFRSHSLFTRVFVIRSVK
ncbi:MAG: caspase family protein [Desulfobacteraceae bacterium]|nr:caspase family protein [Desulfobacteraceae bacterium]